MSMYEQLQRLEQSWPETDDFLTRVGQLNNDRLLLQEAAARESMTVSWMDRLGISAEDLLTLPSATEIARFLHERGQRFEVLEASPEFREDRAEQAELFASGESGTDRPLEDPSYLLSAELAEQLLSSAELASKLVAWASTTSTRWTAARLQPSTLQALMLLRLFQVLEQEPELSPGLVEESVRSLLSSAFFEMAGTPATSR